MGSKHSKPRPQGKAVHRGKERSLSRKSKCSASRLVDNAQNCEIDPSTDGILRRPCEGWAKQVKLHQRHSPHKSLKRIHQHGLQHRERMDCLIINAHIRVIL